ncbi:rotamase CYP 4 [Striga asiatica]|uniref:Rotamase CYP 4 n=1 Tax=Striga asiatica TaxID=4170 RepID=A0A5A7PMD5_STRAF|nr:rotamase CYP 4 [Striga asiatica]
MDRCIKSRRRGVYGLKEEPIPMSMLFLRGRCERWRTTRATGNTRVTGDFAVDGDDADNGDGAGNGRWGTQRDSAWRPAGRAEHAPASVCDCDSGYGGMLR